MTELLFVTHGLSVGGAEMVLIDLVNGLDASRFRSTVVSLSAANPLAARITSPSVRLVCAPRRWRYDLGPVRVIRRLLEGGDVRTVVCFDFYTHFFVALALVGLGRQRPRVLVSVHASRPAGTKQRLQDIVYTRVLRGDDTIVAVCAAQADSLAKEYTIPRSRFRVVHTGVDTRHFDPGAVDTPADELRRALGVSSAAEAILCVANLSPLKDLGNAIRALSILRRERPDGDAVLIIVGRGDSPVRRELDTLASSLDIADRVIFTGPQSDVRPFYALADLFTLSSLTEAFSRSALEALAMGLPCVLTDVGGAREMVREGVDGYVVPAHDPAALADAWARVLDQRVVFPATQIREGLTERFSLERCVSNYEELFVGRGDPNCSEPACA